MKRVVILFLMVTYSLSCIGLGVNRFFCCGKLASVTLQYGAYNNTGIAKSNKKSCCKHEKTSFKIKDAHFNASVFQIKAIKQVGLTNPFINYVFEKGITLNSPLVFFTNQPPGLFLPPIYKVNCTYLI